MTYRKLLLSMMAFFVLIFGATVQAQNDEAGFDLCFGLAEADCEVINEASANGLGDAESFTIDLTVDFSGDELASLFSLAQGFTGDADLSMIEDLNAATFTFDGSFDIAMDEDSETGVNVAGTFTTSFSKNSEDVTELGYEIVLADDVLYSNSGEGWQSIDLIRLMEAFEEADAEMDMSDEATDDEAEMDMTEEDMDEMFGGMDGLGALVEILDLPGFLSYERADDVFTFAVDFSVLQALLEEENEELLQELVITASEIDPSFAFLVPLLPTLIEDGLITVVQTVDTEANIVSNVTFTTDLDLALGILDGSPAVTTVSLIADLGFSNLDAVTASVAPDGAEDITDSVIEQLNAMQAQAEEAIEEVEEDAQPEVDATEETDE
ncbi:MAG: hypothetical protein ACFE0Q_11190 [Anaerolineae bacterium]